VELKLSSLVISVSSLIVAAVVARVGGKWCKLLRTISAGTAEPPGFNGRGAEGFRKEEEYLWVLFSSV
jgi:hypothetical protein